MKTKLNKEQYQLIVKAVEDKCASLMARLVNPGLQLNGEVGKEKTVTLYNNYNEVLKILKEGAEICTTDN